MTDHSLRRVFPRRSVRDADNLGGRYPTVARTGDVRTGKFGIFFDDTNTPVFTSGTVSYPTLLLVGSPDLDSDLTSSIFSSRTKTDMGVTENWRKHHRVVETLTPFVEVGQHEQDMNKSAASYLTGSSLTDLNSLDFSTNLGSKTQFRLTLPISLATTFDPTTASVYYYNGVRRTFEEVAPQLKEPPGQNAVIGTAGTMVGSNYDTKFFDALGNYSVSGSIYEANPSSWLIKNASELLGFLYHDEPKSVLRNTAYAATASQITLANFINQPFLLERVVVELPFQAGPGWFYDVTQLNGITGPTYSTAEIGGPCITFAITNQTATDRRELVLSATIVPNTDTQFGFAATPTCVIPGATQFTGTARFETSPYSSCGTAIYNTINGSTQGVMLTIDPVGRGSDARASGRSAFGRETILPDNAKSIGLQNMKRMAYSPYLFMPNDKIIFSISKYRSWASYVGTTPSQKYYPLYSAHDVLIPTGTMRITFYGSLVRNGKEFHDTLNSPLTTNAVHQVIGAEPIVDQWNIESRSTYSGSYSDNIVTGTFTNFYTSSVGSPTPWVGRSVIGSRSSVTSSIKSSMFFSDQLKETYQFLGTNLTTQITSPNERWWDSLLPSPSEIAMLNGAEPWQGRTLDPGVTSIPVEIDGIGGTDGSPGGHGDYVFGFSFPFAPKYSQLQRKVNITKKVAASKFTPMAAAGAAAYFPPAQDLIGDNFTILTMLNALVLDAAGPLSQPGTPVVFAGSAGETTKAYFGFGDRRSLAPVVGLQYNSTQGVEFANFSFGQWQTKGQTTFFVTSPVIRGWKYGISNGLPQFSRAHYRRDRFGQLRDMLEQRQDTTFYEAIGYKYDGSLGGATGKLMSPVQVRFIAPDGSITSPDMTLSSNLSNEATSSIPYVDGVSTNRPPITYSKIGTSPLMPLVI